MPRFTAGSLFSGIGGMDKGLTDAGMEIRWHVEIDKWGQKVLSRRFPDGQLYSDIREHREYEPVDLIAFGFPCTNLSVAGKRAGLGGDESRLFWAAIAVVRRVRPTWLLIENVPGLLSSNEGRDFGVVLGTLAHLGYWWSYRVLDSQYFGVAQRRRRVFIVCHLGGPCPPEILFEPCGVSGHTQTSQQEGQGVAGTLTESAGHHGHSSPRGDGGDNLVVGSLRAGQRGRNDFSHAAEGSVIAEPIQEWQQNGGAISALVPDISYPLLGKGNDSHDESLETYVVSNGQGDPNRDKERSFALDTKGTEAVTVIQDAREVGKEQNGIGINEGGPMFTLDGTSQHAVGVAENQRGEVRLTEKDSALSSGGGKPGQGYPAVIGAPADAAGVREATGAAGRMDVQLCKCPDGPRYRGLGNAVTRNVAEWLGRRILLAHREAK
ncbi:MAG: DNA (cytosine-5-)-methyltransferase [Dehalococcoidia bacterium]